MALKSVNFDHGILNYNSHKTFRPSQLTGEVGSLRIRCLESSKTKSMTQAVKIVYKPHKRVTWKGTKIGVICHTNKHASLGDTSEER
jgi:hypothetical protein